MLECPVCLRVPRETPIYQCARETTVIFNVDNYFFTFQALFTIKSIEPHFFLTDQSKQILQCFVVLFKCSYLQSHEYQTELRHNFHK